MTKKKSEQKKEVISIVEDFSKCFLRKFGPCSLDDFSANFIYESINEHKNYSEMVDFSCVTDEEVFNVFESIVGK